MVFDAQTRGALDHRRAPRIFLEESGVGYSGALCVSNVSDSFCGECLGKQQIASAQTIGCLHPIVCAEAILT